MSASVTAEQFKAAMARFPGAVTIVTSLADGERRGVTATAVCSVSADPPSLLACVNRRTGTCRAVHDCDRFNVNLLPDPSAALALRFAGAGDATGDASAGHQLRFAGMAAGRRLRGHGAQDGLSGAARQKIPARRRRDHLPSPR